MSAGVAAVALFAAVVGSAVFHLVNGAGDPVPAASIAPSSSMAPAAVDPPVAPPPVPAPQNVAEAAGYAEIRQLIDQYKQAVLTGQDTVARAAAGALVGRGAAAVPLLDEAIAASRNARVRAALVSLKGRLAGS